MARSLKGIKDELDDSDDFIEVTGQTPAHPRYRFARILKDLIKEEGLSDDDIQITGQASSHSRNKLARKNN